jgi:hypothetical protein
VAVSEAGVNQRLYVDGELVSTTAISPLANGDKRVRIGDNPDTEGREWEGCIDEVAIWSRALNVEEIASLWNEGEGRSVLGPDIVDQPLRIESVTLLDVGPVEAVELGWRSKDSQVFLVERSFDQINWEELDDNVESQGEFTTYTDLDLGDPRPQRAYYRLRQLE